MSLNEHELLDAYHDLIMAYPEDLRIARPLIQMLQLRGEKGAAREMAMKMARRMVALGYSSYALAFLNICEQLEHPDTESIASMKTMAELTLAAPLQSLDEAGQVFELIEALSDSESKSFLMQGSMLDVPTGQTILVQGEVGRKFYLILEGDVDVLIDSDDDQHIKVGSLKHGDFFGEVACIYQLPRTATVVAASDARLLEFSDETVAQMIDASPIAGNSLMKVVQRRMLETIALVHPAFAELGVEDRAWLEADSELVEYLAGEPVDKSDEPNNQFFYIIAFGRLEARGAEGSSCSLITNAMYGDAAPVLCFPSGTHLQASERSIVCKMPIQLFEVCARTYGGFEYWVHKHVAGRNKELFSSAKVRAG